MSAAVDGATRQSEEWHPGAEDWMQIQRLVLRPARQLHVRHLFVHFSHGGNPQNFLQELDARCPVSVAGPGTAHPRENRPAHAAKRLRVSVGLSFEGLQRLGLPDPLLWMFRAKAPAFTAGAAVRAAGLLGDCGPSATAHWDERFLPHRLHALVTLHAPTIELLDEASAEVAACFPAKGPGNEGRPQSELLGPPLDGAWLHDETGARVVHFGYQDGLARIAIRHWTHGKDWDTADATSRHALGEFVLGHAQNDHGNPWISDPLLRVLPERARGFFRNASFGVLRQIEQDAAGFADFIAGHARDLVARGLFQDPDEAALYLKTKLCGRAPNGDRITGEPWDAGRRNWDKAEPGSINRDFNFADDQEGLGCPFGAHIRRMNPRAPTEVVLPQRRPLLRRGVPYGPAYGSIWTGERGVAGGGDPAPPVARGLLGQFFCARIEDQFEHLLGQWGDRVPLGSQDRGRAKDPLIGRHEDPGFGFAIPRPTDRAPGSDLLLMGLAPFCTTRGTAYLFYPSRSALRGLAESSLWADDEDVQP